MANADLGERASKARTFTPTPRCSGRTWLAVGAALGAAGCAAALGGSVGEQSGRKKKGGAEGRAGVGQAARGEG